MSDTRRWVEAVLYGAGSLQRFTQHSPILGDVWVAYFEEPKKAIDLIIQPWRDEPPYTVAQELSKSIGTRGAGADITFNRVAVVATLPLKDLILHLVPFSDWYRRLPESRPVGAKNTEAERTSKEWPAFVTRLPTAGELWSDVFPPRSEYPYPRLLPLIRLAGLVAHIAGKSCKDVEKDLDALLASNSGQAKARERLAVKILAAFKKAIANRLPDPKDKSLVYAINRNRPATLALRNSVRTVKADAARSLFKIDCGKLIWAVIDSGIDATHPAFRIRSGVPASQAAATSGKRPLPPSRVVKTFDFSYIREILLGKTDALPARLAGLAKTRKDNWSEIVERVRRGRAIDWQILQPFIEIAHDDIDAYPVPTDPHGTHVAGILGADWEEEGLQGVCPDIKLFDIRVLREDGSSDEFVIMSALQYLRHLNASADFMAVHGVNMSLSLVHDAANYACGRTPVCDEAARSVDFGMVVVAAAGNHGFRRLLGAKEIQFDQYLAVSITDPGNADDVITVGSTHRMEPHTYGVSYFSSRGPTGDGRIKPDLVAPGEKIYGPAPNDGDITLDGTSMAAPHVSGAAALLMARHVELNGRPRRIKQILCDTATDLGRERYFQGHGMVDVLRAIQSV